MGGMLGTNSGSPLEARTGGVIGFWIAMLVVLIVAIVVVFLIYKRVTQYKNSPAYLEKQKKRPTTAADVAEIAKEAELSKDERELLWSIFKVHKTPNALFAIREIEAFEQFLKEKFAELMEAGDEKAKECLFSLRRKLLKAYKQVVVIKNSRAVEAGTKFSYTVARGFHHTLTLVENTPDGMVIGLPKSVEQRKELPEALSKISLIFESRDGSPYEMETRVVRFQTDKNDQKQIFAVHSDKVVPLQKRQTERIDVRMPCKFSSVKARQEGGGLNFTVMEKEHDGTLEDTSTGGCRIITSLAIKPEQYIFIKGPMNRRDEDTAIGQIVRTTKRAESEYVLHVKFLKIDIAVTNRIQAAAIGYDI